MTQWLAVPKCPCGEIMRISDDYVDLWQCIGCGFLATNADLAFMDNEDDDEDEEEDDEE